MKKILILGAGKSASAIISYLLSKAEENDWHVTVADQDQSLAAYRVDGHARGTAVAFNVKDAEQVQAEVEKADIVASLLPAFFHQIVAESCLKNGKHLVTASYVAPESKALDQAFRDKDLLFMGEIGLDPGIDHLGLMKILNELKGQGAKINGVYSYTGALIHPEDDNNPWHYKFTWAPMNVVKAGQGVSMYLYKGKNKYVPYSRLFTSYREREIGDLGKFEIYPNRDSVKYLEKYHLEGVENFMRGTIRREDYCDAWDAIIRLGLTDDTYEIETQGKTYADLLRSYLPLKNIQGNDLKKATATFLQIALDSTIMQQLEYLDLFKETPINSPAGSPAQIMCDLLAEKWKLEKGDRDMIVMLHEVDYELNGEHKRRIADMFAFGEDEEKTAIAKTVGLPAGMMVKLIAQEKTSLRGVHIPIYPEIYEPILAELEEYDIEMKERDVAISGDAL